jgi:hypothetical protein
MELSSVRRCQFVGSEKEILKNCLKLGCPDEIVLKEVLGSGTGGLVVKALLPFCLKTSQEFRDSPFNNIRNLKKIHYLDKDYVNVAIKYIYPGQIETDETNEEYINRCIDEMTYEMNYSYAMARTEIGPDIYDAFYTVDGNVVTGFMVMEHFDISVHRYQTDAGQSISNKLDVNYYLQNLQQVHTAMINLLDMQIYEGLFCTDMKPGNFVIKFEENLVRMIDFGFEFCKQMHSEYFRFKMLLQLFMSSRSNLYLLSHDQQQFVLSPFIEEITLENVMDIEDVIMNLLIDNDTGYVFKYYLKCALEPTIPADQIKISNRVIVYNVIGILMSYGYQRNYFGKSVKRKRSKRIN